jgi:VWFA-related protein
VEKVTVVNIEVPVRVYKDGRFVDNLKKEDFIILEDGVPQKIVAFYLVKKKQIKYKETETYLQPQVNRIFFLLFRLYRYTNLLNEGLETFVKEILTPGDSLHVVTPYKSYSLKKEALIKIPRERLAQELKNLIRRDVFKATTRYRNLLAELNQIVRQIRTAVENPEDSSFYDSSWTVERLVNRYEQIIDEMNYLTGVNEKEFLKFAEFLKKMEGKKYVFIFFQREFLPKLDNRSLNVLMQSFHDNPSLLIKIQQLFTFYHKSIFTKQKELEKYFADSGASLHFIYVKTERESREYAEEASDEFYSSFLTIARATGGGVYPTYNPSAGFEKALEESENYYLIYYQPSNTRFDGRFRKITVKLKKKGYKLQYKRGYFAKSLE